MCDIVKQRTILSLQFRVETILQIMETFIFHSFYSIEHSVRLNADRCIKSDVNII